MMTSPQEVLRRNHAEPITTINPRTEANDSFHSDGKVYALIPELIHQ